MYRYLLTCLLFVLAACYNVKAQATLEGKVYELNTSIKLQSIRVTNLNSKQFTTTDTSGRFYINAKNGDLLAFRGYAYVPDTLMITNKNRLIVFLQPEGKMLNEVKVSAPSTKLGNLKDPDLRNQPVVYQRDENGNYKGGVAIRFGYGKDKKAIHSKQLTDEEMADDEINEAFSVKGLNKLIPLKGEELQNFILMYRPTIKMFKAPGFNLTLYVNDSYKQYLALPPGKRKPATIIGP